MCGCASMSQTCLILSIVPSSHGHVECVAAQDHAAMLIGASDCAFAESIMVVAHVQTISFSFAAAYWTWLYVQFWHACHQMRLR